MILSKEKISSVNIDLMINEFIKTDELRNLLIIVPTNRKLRSLKKNIIGLSPNAAATKINIETLSTLSKKLLELSTFFIELSEAASSVLISQSAKELTLEYFSNFDGKIPYGTLNKIKNVIGEYKKEGITPGKLRKEAGKLDRVEKLKTIDIAAIFENYSARCFNLNAFEIGDIYNKLLRLSKDEFNENYRKVYNEVTTVIINGFDEFTNSEIDIINKLSLIDNNRLFINFDYYGYNPALFSHLTKCYKKFKEKKFSIIKDLSKDSSSTFTQFVKENLFLNSLKNPNPKFQNEITKITAANRQLEVEVIAKEIKLLITRKRIAPHKICVAFNLIQNYSALVREIFASYGIPLNLTDRKSLDNSQPVSDIIHFLEILENDFFYKNIFRATSKGFIEIEGFDFTNLLKISTEQKITFGKRNWIAKIEDTIERINSGMEDIENKSKKILRLQKALLNILKLEELLKPFDKKLTVVEFQDNLISLIDKLNIFEKLLEPAEGNEEQNIKSVTVFLDTIQEILKLLELENGPGKRYSLKFYLDEIRTAARWARYNIKEKSDYGVLVTNINEIRGLSFSYLFIGGLCDRDFPARYQPEIFHSGSFIKGELNHIVEQRYHFYQALCSWKTGLYLTVPQNEAGNELVESSFIGDFENIFTIKNKKDTDYEGLIFTREEYLSYIGSKKFNVSLRQKQYLEDFTIYNFDKLKSFSFIDQIRINDETGQTIFTGYLQNGETTDQRDFERHDIFNFKLSENAKKHIETFKEQNYSISQLETYAKCPFKYFIERILKLETWEEPTEYIEAVELGSLLHEILFDFYSKIRQEGVILAGCSNNTFRKAKEMIFNTGKKKLEGIAIRSPLAFYEKEKILGINGNENESILYQFLKRERENETNFIPEFFEIGFGNIQKSKSDLTLNTQQPIDINGIRIRGKIDRIDIDENLSLFSIIDYKLSGNKPTIKDLWEGISLQLPVYMYAGKLLLDSNSGKNFSYNSMIIYSLKYQSDKFGKQKVNITRKRKITTEEETALTNDLIESTKEHISNFVEAITRGAFGLSNLEDREGKVCRFCDFRTICRIEDCL